MAMVLRNAGTSDEGLVGWEREQGPSGEIISKENYL